MSQPVFELDHAGIAVRDLDAAEAAYRRLGFNLTPRSIHSGSVEPGGPVVPWGSGNHCAMFADGYLEIVGLTDPALHSSVKTFLERYEGAHIIAIGSGDTDATYRALSTRSEGVKAPVRLQRDAAFGPDGAETRLAAFSNISIDSGFFPEGKLIFIEHLTRDVIWQPHLLEHPNGTVALAEVGFCVADVAATSEKLGRLLDLEWKEVMPGVARFQLPRGTIYVMSAAAMAKWTPGVTPPCIPYVATVGFAVRDLEATRGLLRDNGIAFTDHRYPALWIVPEYTCGPVISFIQA
jgi:catechol 2,3-dioxygenase-like lactoylglutathione lyase family enzyme